MNKIEFAVAEETTIETTEHQDFELSLAELDMVGGGTAAVINA
jgi:hypothetical protein